MGRKYENGLFFTPKGMWERARFTVPATTPDEKVQFHADKYRKRYGDHLESNGFTVLAMTQPERKEGGVGIAPDRTLYLIYALVKRRPRDLVMDIPDEAVPYMLEHGLKLKEKKYS